LINSVYKNRLVGTDAEAIELSLDTIAKEAEIVRLKIYDRKKFENQSYI